MFNQKWLQQTPQFDLKATKYGHSLMYLEQYCIFSVLSPDDQSCEVFANLWIFFPTQINIVLGRLAINHPNCAKCEMAAHLQTVTRCNLHHTTTKNLVLQLKKKYHQFMNILSS